MTDRTDFAAGGYVPGPDGSGTVPVTLDDAECVLLAADVAAGTPVCRRHDARHLDAAHGRRAA